MKKTPAELILDIIDGNIQAISLDTSVFSGNGNALEQGALASLRQFRGSSVRLVLSDVVLKELLTHLSLDADASKSTFEGAARRFARCWAVDESQLSLLQSILENGATADEMAKTRLRAFAESTGHHTAQAAQFCRIDRLVSDYFSAAAPFAIAGAKKNEFPDAIALHSLEGWAESAKTLMLVVTKDKDWLAFCEGSPALTAISELTDALSLFNHQSTVTCARLSQLEMAGKFEAADTLFGFLVDTIYDLPIYPEGSSSYRFTSEIDEIKVVDVSLAPVAEYNGVGVLFKAVEREPHRLLVESSAVVDLEVAASFSFYVVDSIDKDEQSVGNSYQTAHVTIELRTLFYLDIDKAGGADIFNIEIENPRRGFHVHFGEVKPSWHEDGE